MISESYIRACAIQKRVFFGTHARQRMAERMISESEVYDALLNGKVLETQDRRLDKEVAVILQGPSQGEPEFYVVVVASYPTIRVVSVCRFKDDVWEDVGNLMKRRRGTQI